jgi:hypothetical protein
MLTALARRATTRSVDAMPRVLSEQREAGAAIV